MHLLERPGYLGKRRDGYVASLNEQYGQDGWQFVWKWGSLTLSFVEACAVYEDAYWWCMQTNQYITQELVAVASDVYDDAPSNVASGLDYNAQETGRTHVQDIAIRRCLRRLGLAFEGTELLQIRDSLGDHPLSMELSPGQVPFHRPQMIEPPQLTGWWQPDTVEAFYQSNRYVAVLD